MKIEIKKYFFVLLLITCFCPSITSTIALFLGLGFSLLFKNPFQTLTNKWGGIFLKASVIGLGFGINLEVLLSSGKANIGVSAAFVLGVLIVGLYLGKLLKVNKTTSILIAAGTAICGGSAIAAIGSILKADSDELSVSTGTVFILNAIALLIFPAIGHWFHLDQTQFGTWAAIAIHDTSSVMGASAKYGDEALRIASITKMLRILWIIPVSLLLVVSLKESRESFKIPMFIIGFIAACFLHSFFTDYEKIYSTLYTCSKQGLVISLFLVGSSISRETLKTVGGKVLGQAVILWIIVISAAMFYVKY